MQKQQKLEIGERIKELRERSPFKQEAIAQKLGLKLRSYQKLEAVGTEDFERCEELYDIHKEWAAADPAWAHLSAGWIWDGRARDGGLMESLSEAEPASLAKVQEMLQRVLDQQAQLLADVSEVRSEQARLSPLIERLGRGRAAKRT